MAKCTTCNARKGKRKCKVTESFICSQCCGESRQENLCTGCSFFTTAAANRNYKKLPYFTTQEMSDSLELEDVSHVIEATLCRVWHEDYQGVNDRTVTLLVELLLDKYHFHEESQVKDSVLAERFESCSTAISEELPDLSEEKMVKVLGAVYRSIERRSEGGSTYLKFINRFAGGSY